MQCPACAAENPADYLFCDTCGVALAVHCAQCGANGRPGARFCGQCGAPLAPPRPAPHPQAEAPPAGCAVPLQAAAARGLTPFTGRDRELGVLLELFANARNGRGQVVFVAGDAGIGKSRLVYELRRHRALADEESTWLEGRCVSFGQTMPLLPVIDQVRALCGIDEADGADDIIAKVDTAMDRLGDLPPHVPYLRYLLCVDPGDAAVPQMDGALRRARTFAAVRALALRAAQQRPLVLVFEDLHWVDSSTQQYLAALVDAVAGAPILLICTYRLGCAPPFGTDFPTLTLPSLSEHESLALAGGALGAAALPDEVATALMQKTDGVPLFLEEVATTLLDLGALQRYDGGYRMVRSIAEVDVPDTIEGLIMARLDRLGESAKRLAQLAAVIGRNCSRRLIERIAEVPAQLQGLLAELERRDIIREQGPAPESAYVFRHAVIQGVAYDSLPLPRRKELHRAVGCAIEELCGERLPEHYGELAHHFAAGELWARALEFAQLAGDQAALAYANVEANGHYGAALQAAEHLQPPPQAGGLAALHVKRGAVLSTLGQSDASIAHYERALALVRDIGDRRAEVGVLLAVADIHYNHHRGAEAQSYCEQALEIADALQDPAAQVSCHASRSVFICAWQGPVAEARRSAKIALEIAEQVDNPRARARTLIALGSVLQWRADIAGCLPYLQQGAVLAEQTHSGDILAQALFQLGHANLACGRYQQALHWYGEMSRYAADANDNFWIARAPNVVGGVHLELHDYETAIRLCVEGAELAQRLCRWPEPRGQCLVKLGAAQLQCGQHDAAEETLRLAWSLLDLDTWARWRWLMPLLRARAELLLATDRIDEAWTYASQSLELAAQTDSRQHVALAKLLLGEIAAAQDRLPEAEKLLRSALGLAEHLGAVRALWLSASALGQTLAHVGRDRDAEAYLIQAAQTVETIAHDLTDPVLRKSFTEADPVAEVYRQLGRRPVPIAG